jgi:hypothetical protein
MKKFLSMALVLAMLLMLAPAVFAEDGYQDGDSYTFTDREGNTVTVPVSAFASYVVEFTHGDPWTSHEENMDPEIALGLPDSSNDAYSTGDLCLGINGVLVLGFDSLIYDGPGDDVYVFEVGPAVEETKVEVSSDLTTWYVIGIAEGRTAGLDMAGKVPSGSSFRYVRVTDTGNNEPGGWSGADIDAVCGLNVKPASPVEPEPEPEPAPAPGGGEKHGIDGGYYSFYDRDGYRVTVPLTAFAYRVIDFQAGDPWTSVGANKDPLISLGIPDADDSYYSTGDLCLGFNGVLTVMLDARIYDGEGKDVYIFEVGDNVEETKVEVSDDLVTWYEIGIVEGRTAGLDFAGRIPAGSGFRYVRLTDTGNNDYNGNWPGADIDAVCGLHTRDVESYTETATLTYKDIKISIDGQLIQPTDAQGNSTEPFILNDSTYLPLRAVAGALGCDVGWDGATATITLTSGMPRKSAPRTNAGRYATEEAVLTYRGIRIVLDGRLIIPKDVKGNVLDAFIFNNSTYLPVRAVADALGCSVDWDGDTNTVLITT